MLEPKKKWSAAAQSVDVQGAGFSVKSVPGLDQWLVSGDFAAAGQDAAIDREPVSALALTHEPAYAVRVARDRVLFVADTPIALRSGWSDRGYFASPAGSALHVLDISGERAPDIVKRGCVIDPRSPGPSAAIAFAGATAFLYRAPADDAYRLHFDRGLLTYFRDWFETHVALL